MREDLLAVLHELKADGVMSGYDREVDPETGEPVPNPFTTLAAWRAAQAAKRAMEPRSPIQDEAAEREQAERAEPGARTAARIAELVSRAPPLSQAQLARLAAVFLGPGPLQLPGAASSHDGDDSGDLPRQD
jgi:hypothetical protein